MAVGPTIDPSTGAATAVGPFGFGEGHALSFGPDPVAVLPMPAALPLLVSALAGLGVVGWRQRRAA